MRNVMMAKGAGTVVNRCAQVKAGETVLIVTEASRMSIAECLAEAVCAAGAQPVLSVILPRAVSYTHLDVYKRQTGVADGADLDVGGQLDAQLLQFFDDLNLLGGACSLLKAFSQLGDGFHQLWIIGTLIGKFRKFHGVLLLYEK